MEEFKFAYLRPVLRINIHLSGILDGTWFYEFSLCLCWCVRMNLGTIRGWLGGDTLTVMDGENGPHGCVCCRGAEVLGRQCQCGTPSMIDQHMFFFPDKGTWKTTNSDGKSFYSSYPGSHLFKFPWPQCPRQFSKRPQHCPETNSANDL